MDTAWLRTRVAAGVGLLTPRFDRIGIRLVSDATMADLHGRYCGDPTTTDVLTFHDPETDPPAVDLILCVDEASRQAASRRHPIERELLLYALHGLLHCIGHDDHDEQAAAAMHAEEDRLLEAIGVGATYRRPAIESETPSIGLGGGAPC